MRSDSWKASRSRAVVAASAGKLPAKTSSDMPAEKCLPVDEITSARVAPSSLEPAHRVANGGEERRRHRVQSLGPVQLQVGDAVLVRECEEFVCGVGHGGGGERWGGRFEPVTGMALVRRDWPSADARGTIVIVHGLGEHIGRYAHVAARLNASRWNVVGYDQRGHGASPGERGRLAAGDDLLADLAAVIDAVRAEVERPARPARPQPRRPGRGALRRRRARVAAAGVAARRRRAGDVVAGARHRHDRAPSAPCWRRSRR